MIRCIPVNCNLRPLSYSFSICLGKGREANVVRDFETLAYFIGSFNWPSPCLKMFKSFLSPLFVFSFVGTPEHVSNKQLLWGRSCQKE
jgi:hypothetical protein